MKTRFYIVAVVAAVALSSCGSWLDDRYMPFSAYCASDHFIAAYAPPSEAIAKLNDSSLTIWFSLNGAELVDLSSTGEAGERFLALAVKHEDMTYDSLVEYVYWGYAKSKKPRDSNRQFVNVASAADIVSIIVTSEYDWDEKHPAGTSLNDVISFSGSSIDRYIRSGYVTNEIEQHFVKPLDSMSPDDYRLVLNFLNNFSFSLLYDSLPTLYPDGKRNIIVTVTFDDGKVMPLKWFVDF